MNEDRFDIVVIGGGPGGYVAAIRAAQLGMKTAIVEKAALGGICLNWGCIPTKALLQTADVLRLLKRAGDFGIRAQVHDVQLQDAVQRSREIASQLGRGVAHLMKKNGVRVFNGRARLKGDGRVDVDMGAGGATTLAAKHIVVASGARPRELPALRPDGDTIWTYFDALRPATQPRRLLVVGAGAIGIEFASFYRALGADVTVVERAGHVLPSEDQEVSAALAHALTAQGIMLRTGSGVTGAERRADGGWHVTVDGEHAGALDVDVILVAAGVTGNVEDLGLEHTRVRVERGHIVTHGCGATDEPGVHAIGDVAGPPCLAHKASHEGVLCVERIAGLPVHALDPGRIPACTYSHPQVASVGLNERQAREAGRAVRVGRFPFAANGKAIAAGATEGFVKVLFDAASGELLGAHMVGHEVTEMIQGYAIGRQLETTEHELAGTVFAHPTQSEAMHEAVLAAYGRALHS
ncbi:dihydrolipoyl dehydrogenase [Burkholderia pseudomultivorans]|uniref:dihydrolipoyl dehydrogenase n=1 Tax=Burkholderia pseudomultivorans TaxID=1207504 RepID=UPI00287418DB|nr:dihydrolipoyl dehydrogenase [Burkholderia pseudomultivorans]MDS0856947.1 dihydrolipoyl dehydrogenase [Burkholderia pseudomultivorans]